MPRTARPQLTLKILLYAIFDVVGMVLFAAGALWLVQGTALFAPDFPSGTIEAAASLVIGLMLMLWAASRILRELLRRPANNTREGS